MTDTKVDYDSNSDLLYVYREGSEIKREVDVGDMVIQLDSEVSRDQNMIQYWRSCTISSPPLRALRRPLTFFL
ncbi:MAG: DUF2283 domain-containing protein [Candidatus Nanohalobium sp.]